MPADFAYYKNQTLALWATSQSQHASKMVFKLIDIRDTCHLVNDLQPLIEEATYEVQIWKINMSYVCSLTTHTHTHI